jgi:hypothetical protein
MSLASLLFWMQLNLIARAKQILWIAVQNKDNKS